jgi:hypothetical protein
MAVGMGLSGGMWCWDCRSVLGEAVMRFAAQKRILRFDCSGRIPLAIDLLLQFVIEIWVVHMGDHRSGMLVEPI